MAKIKILDKGYYPFSDDEGDAHVSGFELHKVDSEAFANDKFMYFFDNDYYGFEVVYE